MFWLILVWVSSGASCWVHVHRGYHTSSDWMQCIDGLACAGKFWEYSQEAQQESDSPAVHMQDPWRPRFSSTL